MNLRGVAWTFLISRQEFRPTEAESTSGCPIGLAPSGAQSHARHLKSISGCRRAPMQVARSRRSRTVESVSSQSRKEKCVLAPVIRCDLPATILSPGVRPTPRRHRQFESLLSTGLSSAINNKRTTVQLLLNSFYAKSPHGGTVTISQPLNSAAAGGLFCRPRTQFAIFSLI